MDKTGRSKIMKTNFLQLGREWAKPYQQPDVGEAKGFVRKIWEREDHNKNSK